MVHQRRGGSSALLVCLLAALVLGSCAKNALDHDADLLSEQGDYGQAEKLYRQALAADPADAEAHLGLAGVLAAAGDASGADQHFTRAQQLHPAWAERIAEERRDLGTRYAMEALDLAGQDRAAEAIPKLAGAETLSRGLGATAYVRGRLAEAEGDSTAAAGHYREAHRIDPEDPRYRQALLGLLVASGRSAKEAGRLQDAHRDLEEAAALNPGPEVRYLLGSVAFDLARQSSGEEQTRRLDEAAAAFREVIRVRPGDRDASYNLGAVLLTARRFDEAVAWYRELISRDPRDPDLYLALSLAHSQLDRPQDARIEEAVGRALRAHQPVDDPAGWSRRSAARFPESDLSRKFERDGPPQEVETYQRQEGGLVEVWFYWDKGTVVAFRDGGRVGADLVLPAQ